MRIFRGDDYARTDSRLPADYIKEWKKHKRIALNGTKRKSGARWTRLWVEIDESDVRELAIALLELQRDEEARDQALSSLCSE
jgi:hypothetical protein